MKNYISKTVSKIVLVLVLATSGFRSNASDTAKALPEMAIRYEGLRDGRPVFSVYFANTATSPVILSISDEDGYVLYEERPLKGQYARKFAVDMAGFSDINLRVTLSDQWGVKKKTYSINSTTSITTDLSISQR